MFLQTAPELSIDRPQLICRFDEVKEESHQKNSFEHSEPSFTEPTQLENFKEYTDTHKENYTHNENLITHSPKEHSPKVTPKQSPKDHKESKQTYRDKTRDSTSPLIQLERQISIARSKSLRDLRGRSDTFNSLSTQSTQNSYYSLASTESERSTEGSSTGNSPIKEKRIKVLPKKFSIKRSNTVSLFDNFKPPPTPDQSDTPTSSTPELQSLTPVSTQDVESAPELLKDTDSSSTPNNSVSSSASSNSVSNTFPGYSLPGNPAPNNTEPNRRRLPRDISFKELPKLPTETIIFEIGLQNHSSTPPLPFEKLTTLERSQLRRSKSEKVSAESRAPLLVTFKLKNPPNTLEKERTEYKSKDRKRASKIRKPPPNKLDKLLKITKSIMESPTKKSRLDDDNESLYSFESISTNGRLLDKLDLDDYDEHNRFSMLSNNDRVLDKFEFEEFPTEGRQPIASIPNLARFEGRPNLSAIRRIGLVNQRTTAQDTVLRHVQKNIVYSNGPTLGQANFADPRNGISRANTLDSRNSPVFSNLEPRFNPRPEINEARPITQRTSSAPIAGNADPLHRRVVSESLLIGPLRSLLLSLVSLLSLLTDTNASRINAALQLRAVGKPREASYQLQALANFPNNVPRAMYLYALALRSGDGVKQNDLLAIKWLCKCILINVHLTLTKDLQDSEKTSNLIEKLNDLTPASLVKLILKQLTYTAASDPLKHGNNPQMCHLYFLGMLKNETNRLFTVFKNKIDIVSLCYYELGKMLFNGLGVEARDELNGIKLLLVAGSLGNIDSMIHLGEIWTMKSKHYKKDYGKASAWLRLSELFGIKSMGNSWIYKEKYTKIGK